MATSFGLTQIWPTPLNSPQSEPLGELGKCLEYKSIYSIFVQIRSYQNFRHTVATGIGWRYHGMFK